MLPAKNRYLDKLQLLGLDEDGKKFVDDMSLWPPVEYGHKLSTVYTLLTAPPPVCSPNISCYNGKTWTFTITS